MKLYWTSKGRVVYDRRKHPFSVRDILRIGKKLGAEVFRISSLSAGNPGDKLFECLETDADTVIEETDYQAFNGGNFGGAGTTRGYDAGTPVSRIIIIVI